MSAFRILLAIVIISIIGFTGIVIFNHGWNLLPIFFGDMEAMTWPGQFNFDFMCFLVLSALWLAWRHHFPPGGLALGVLGFWRDNGTRSISPCCELHGKWRHKSINAWESQGR